MRIIREWIHRLGGTLNPGRRDDDLAEELRLHAALAAESGRRADGAAQAMDALRDQRGLPWLEDLGRDLRYGLRSLRRTPGFTAVALLTLAFGIGANVTMFSVMYAVLWRPLPYPAADRLVVVDADVLGAAAAGVASGELRHLTERSRSMEAFASIVGVDAHLDLDGRLERLPAASVSDAMLPLLGGTPLAAGRALDSRIDVKTDPSGFWSVASIIVSDEFRQQWLQGERDVIGRRLRVNNLDVEIVGVLRPGFRAYLPPALKVAERIDIWFPTALDPSHRGRGYAGLARLKPGASIAQAQAELDAIAVQFVAEFSQDYPGRVLRLRARPLTDLLTDDARRPLWAVGGAVAFVLLICCVNVANLMLARSRARDREFAVRRAIGGTRGRIVRQLCTENLAIVAAGAGLGLALAVAGVALLDWIRPPHLPRQSQIRIDWVVAAYTIALSSIVGLVFGLVPAMRVAEVDRAEALRPGRADTPSRRVRRLQRGLVVAEVALSIVPLVAAGLMLRTFVNLTHAPIGFDPDGLLTARMSYSFRAFPDIRTRWALQRDAMNELRTLPDVEDVSAVTPLPFGPVQLTRRFARVDDQDGPQSRATMQAAVPGYFSIAGIHLEGRDFSEADILSRRPVVIVDERLAAQLWPAGAIGQRLRVEGVNAPLEVIGVTNPVRVTRVRDAAMPHLFLPYHLFAAEMTLVLKTRTPAAALAPAIRQTVESLGTTRPVTDIRPMRDYVELSIGDTRFTMLVLLGFAGAAVLLAAIGLYGTLAYLVSQRTREFGVRIALGASTAQLMRSVARDGFVLAAAGGTIGLIGALAVSGVLRGLLYEVTPFDPLTLAGAVAIFILIALVATTHPAWRLSRFDPIAVLRAE